ncbi:hypothetical protein [Paenibacillus sp. NPDC058071]|uniref:hypothetical protein n=1 Tax=Paenibacillus sp. NPDC058071 TaxID=3346326 RepID=UPI0036D75CAA
MKEWKVYGRLQDGSQLQTQTLTSSDSVKFPFSFTISKNKLDNLDTYTETYVMRAVVFFTDGSTAENVIECTTTVTKPGATPTPAPGQPTPEPTPTPPAPIEAKIRFSPPQIFTGEKSTLINESKGNIVSHEWGFSSNLDPLVPDKNAYEIGELTFTESGPYEAELSLTGSEGQTDSDTATLIVIDPKPVAIVAGIPRAIQGRPLKAPYNLDQSYTPLASRGVTIDHTKDEKRYKKLENTNYLPGFPVDYAPNDLGQYSIEGKVYDSQGRVSDWGSMILEVVPDEPPIVEISVQPETYRGIDTTIFVNADSPDGDQLVSMIVEERFDSNYDSNFEDESWRTIYTGPYKTEFNKKYTSVGKRQYRATVTEDYGLSGNSTTVQIDVINQMPFVDFDPKGITQQPGDDSGPPVVQYAPESIYRSWSLKKPYVGGNDQKIGWKFGTNAISTKNAREAEFYNNYPNLGDGPNGRSQNNLTDNPTTLPSWAFDTTSVTYGGGYRKELLPKVFNGNRMVSHDIEVKSDYSQVPSKTYYRYIINVHNARTGNVLNTFMTPYNEGGYQKILTATDPGDLIYYVTPDRIMGYDLSGTIKKEIPLPLNYNLTTYNHNLALSDDGKFLYAVYSTSNGDVGNYTFDVRAAKYSMTTGVQLWDIKVTTHNFWGAIGNKTDILSKNGNLYIGYQYATYSWSGGAPRGIGLAYVDANGILQYHHHFGYGSMSAPVVSDDGQLVYLQTWENDGFAEWTGSYLFNLQTKTYAADFGSRYRTDDWKLSRNMFVQNPLVLPDSNVLYGNQLRNKYFGVIGAYGQGQWLSGRTLPRRPVVQSNGRVLTVGIKEIGVGVNKFSIMENHATAHDFAYDLPFNAEGTSSITTNITPDGSIYLLTVHSNGFIGPGLADDYLDNMNSRYIYVTPFVPRTEGAGGVVGEIDPNTVRISNKTWGGLFYDPFTKMKNQVLEFQASINHLSDNEGTIGAAIRIQDEKNMYSVEWTNNTLTLYKAENGSKTALRQIGLTRSLFQIYQFKLEAMGSDISVTVNGQRLLQAADSRFSNGSAGIMSLGQQQAAFSNVKRTNFGDMIPEIIYNAVLIDDPIQYDKLFGDPEFDPIGAESWTYDHDPNALAQPLGFSQHNGKTYASALGSLEKPGLYNITYFAFDKPGAPNYEKQSNTVTKPLIVHRRPVAKPSVRFTGIVYPDGEVLDYLANDQSYDPDVPNRLEDRVFRTRWADEEKWTTGQRRLYGRPGIELIIQEQVKDIHGAWSYWEETRVYKEKLPPVNQTKPRMTITVPNGTMTSPTVYVTDPTVHWIYRDNENDPQEEYQLFFTYVDTGKPAFFTRGIGDDLSYEIPQGTIEPGRVVKVHGNVFSNGAWSDDSNIVYFVLNRPPVTRLLSMNGTKASEPIYTNNNRPQLRVAVADPENHPIRYVDYEVFFNASGNKVIDTETATNVLSYTPPTPLQEGLHNWRARANDTYMWGLYSENGYFFVDTVKPDDVDEQLDIKPTSVKVTWNPFKDAAPSSGHATRTFFMQQVNADRSVTTIDLNNDGTPEYSLPLLLGTNAVEVKNLRHGQEYRLTVIDYDRAGNEGHYAYIYFVTNRPPTADLDWSPKPVYEGDRLTIRTLANDPDLDELSVRYTIRNPAGITQSFNYTFKAPYPDTGPQLRVEQPGQWQVELMVSDGIAEPVVVTKAIEVLPLSVTGEVRHTPLWDQHRREYNKSKSGDEQSPRGYDVFWAGEKFVLRATTTLTGTETKAERVEVQMNSFSAKLATSDASGTNWAGELWEESFEKLKNGPLTFIFTAYYNNGTVKRDEVTVTIDGTIYDILGVHRVR